MSARFGGGRRGLGRRDGRTGPREGEVGEGVAGHGRTLVTGIGNYSVLDNVHKWMNNKLTDSVVTGPCATSLLQLDQTILPRPLAPQRPTNSTPARPPETWMPHRRWHCGGSRHSVGELRVELPGAMTLSDT